jgi:hypothetical protein
VDPVVSNEGAGTMKTKTNLKAGGVNLNHNETLRGGLRLKTHVKAGGVNMQHNETLARGLKLRTALKAGRKAGGFQPDW